ncbi:ribosome maturation factor RimM [Meiothermus ruber]|jgi:16S rRNA processing protein RimM|uniref:Ribosome maturation factor RimM n=1 Tax=Meiothermus ruber (strain ATCC 35948 / DSM 1279 / VKM B-1258 / 21) TaxID=504728 RepID=D3PQP1_MEIRD|nr:ribosome maturation factor RimM [Meiothermus ruber]ADD27774.1 16S rRNA processing protein RimM [Meiothermus ruber DSM 1279]AGK04239.1 16S rRNA-processing protein RimM [Meiothermus ruber DSM 1279]MCL6530712.1 ribosome maturation factor RimM [Meiothermus ruber]GAO74702.1 16S rRNA processing protein RimM [Meiothermus ruber H328]
MRRIEIGRIGKAYGMAGGLKFRGEPVIFDLERIYLEGLGYRAIEEIEEHSGEIVLFLTGVEGRQEAEQLVGLRVYADQADLPPLEEGEYYYFELIGRPVFVDGQPFGEVVDVEDGAQERLIIKARGASLRAQSKTYMVPFQAPYVKVEADGIYIESIPGLLD